MSHAASSRYAFLVETYETEILKVLSVWAMFEDGDLRFRPHRTDRRGRSVLEQMVHQSVSENLWFETMLGIVVTPSPLPPEETRRAFLELYARNASLRLEALRGMPDRWWEEEARFFEVVRTRAWIVTRRIAHTAHHRGQQTGLLRMLNRDLHSTYGPTADTGGLMQNDAPVIYAYAGIDDLLGGGPRTSLPGPGARPATERPEDRHPRRRGRTRAFKETSPRGSRNRRERRP